MSSKDAESSAWKSLTRPCCHRRQQFQFPEQDCSRLLLSLRPQERSWLLLHHCPSGQTHLDRLDACMNHATWTCGLYVNSTMTWKAGPRVDALPSSTIGHASCRMTSICRILLPAVRIVVSLITCDTVRCCDGLA